MSDFLNSLRHTYKPSFTPTSEQNNIFRAMSETDDHLLIHARAGCGKTTTIVEGMKLLNSGSVGFMAFGTDIVNELRDRLPTRLQRHVRTMHSFGRAAIADARQCNGIPGRLELDKRRVYTLMNKLSTAENIRHWPRGSRPLYKWAVSLAKNAFPHHPDEISAEALHHYISDYVDLPTVKNLRPTDIIKYLMRESLDYSDVIDFDDMIYITLALDLNVPRYRTLLIDEAQDLNHSQHKLVHKSGERLIAVGDDRQAIYYFRGALSNSMSTLRSHMEQTSRKVQDLSLTLTQRCAKSIVRVAQTLVPDIQAKSDAPDGTVKTIVQTDFYNALTPGDMVLCRTNRPLVEMIFRLWRMDIKAYIRGRDFGDQLLNLVYSWNTESLTNIIEHLDRYYQSKLREYEADDNDGAIAMLNDKVDCIRFFIHSSSSYSEFQNRIEDTFKDTGPKNAIQLCTVHKAKGLEATNVFIIHPEQMPHVMASTPEEQHQELNLLYVAVTRAKTNLYFVGSIPTPLTVESNLVEQSPIDELRNQFQEALDELLS